jgi:hypothetical protein
MGREQRSVTRRRRIRHDVSFEDRLARAAHQAREAAELLPPGLDRELLLRKASACETAAEIHLWISSPGAEPPQELLQGLARKSPSAGSD